jgi:hypothetical protein
MIRAIPVYSDGEPYSIFFFPGTRGHSRNSHSPQQKASFLLKEVEKMQRAAVILLISAEELLAFLL